MCGALMCHIRVARRVCSMLCHIRVARRSVMCLPLSCGSGRKWGKSSAVAPSMIVTAQLWYLHHGILLGSRGALSLPLSGSGSGGARYPIGF